MAEEQNPNTEECRRIVVIRNGPYVVEGDIPLVHKTQVVSEFGEPLTWQNDGPLPTGEGKYYLCRCGGSSRKPFCDGTHRRNGFDGTETADTDETRMRSFEIPYGTHIVVKKDSSLCMLSGFCGMRDASLAQLVASTEDTTMRALVMAMVERCPSGALTYSIEPGGAEIEPDLPKQVAATTEITSKGPIRGPLWVTGGIPVLRSDGQPFESRSRVTLCNCGQSCKKPLCDGTHRKLGVLEDSASKD
jgi:CDGSH-type Zn-finger protein